MSLKLNKKEQENANLWYEEHCRHCVTKKEYPETHYRVHPTGVGYVIILVCECTREINITDYNSW